MIGFQSHEGQPEQNAESGSEWLVVELERRVAEMAKVQEVVPCVLQLHSFGVGRV